MNRTIKFRGFNRKDNKWFYGNLSQFDGGDCAINDIAVDPDTLGQFTGLLDKNGKEIYEGDIISLRDYIAEVRWNSNLSAFCIRFSFESELGIKPLGSWIDRRRCCNVIGNIHDNPEQLNEK